MKEKLVNIKDYLSDFVDELGCFLKRHFVDLMCVMACLYLGLSLNKTLSAPQFGMVDVHEINQSFVAYLAQVELSDSQKSQMLSIYSEALDSELERISDEAVLFSSSQVVTPLDDYTPQIKQAISDALLEANRVHKLP